MNHRIVTILIINLLVVIFPARAGEVRIWMPKELNDRSDIAIIGQPLEIKATGEKGSIQLGGGRILPTVFYTAKLRVDEVIKGDDLLKEIYRLRSTNEKKVISITYSIIDEAKVVGDHYVHRFKLKEDGLFLLYLKVANGGGYVAALDGETDDGQAAALLRIQVAE